MIKRILKRILTFPLRAVAFILMIIQALTIFLILDMLVICMYATTLFVILAAWLVRLADGKFSGYFWAAGREFSITHRNVKILVKEAIK